MLRAFIAALALIPAIAWGQVQYAPFQPAGMTRHMTANTTGNIPTPIQAIATLTPPMGSKAFQYLVCNEGVNTTYVSYAATSALATTNCTAPPSLTVTSLASSCEIITIPISGAYFCGITNSGTSVIGVAPGDGF